MTEFYEANGKVMASEPAGGHGGGVTSQMTREATPIEAAEYHQQRVALAEAALEAAKAAHVAHQEATAPAEPAADLPQEAQPVSPLAP